METRVRTYRDAIEHLLSYADSLSEEGTQRRARSAVHRAYDDVAYTRRWKYLQTHDRLWLSAPYRTGTITYAADTGRVSLAGGVWPQWAGSGTLAINGHSRLYRASQREDDATLTLEAGFAPPDSISEPAAYTLFRSRYGLPADLWALDEIHDESNYWSRAYLSADEWLVAERRIGGTQRPFAWTVIGSGQVMGALAIHLHGYPAQAESLDFIYTRAPRQLKLDGLTMYSSMQGKRVTNATGTTVVLDDSVNEEVVGAVLRLSLPGATTEPEGLDSPNRYAYQRMIVARPDANTLSLEEAIGTGGCGDRYTISDPLDIAPYMWSALQAGMEYYWQLVADPLKAERFEPRYRRELLKAMERDAAYHPQMAGGWQGWRHPAWHLLTGTIAPS